MTVFESGRMVMENSAILNRTILFLTDHFIIGILYRQLLNDKRVLKIIGALVPPPGIPYIKLRL